MKKKSKLFFWVVALVLVFSFTSTAFAKTYDYYETTIKHEDEGDSKLDKLKSHQCYDSNWHCRKNDIKGDKIKYQSWFTQNGRALFTAINVSSGNYYMKASSAVGKVNIHLENHHNRGYWTYLKGHYQVI